MKRDPNNPDPFNPPPFNDWSPLGPELPLEMVPLVCRFLGEPGYVELDRYARPVGVKGAAA